MSKAARASASASASFAVAALPVLEVISGLHIQTDLTLGLGTVIHDYLGK